MFTRFDFLNATPEALADRLGELEARKASIALEIELTKARVLDLGIESAVGKRYALKVAPAHTRESFKPSKAKAFLSAAQISACTESVSVKASVRVNAKKESDI